MRAPGDRRLRLTRNEIAGGLGDSGLLLPIAIAMITVNGLNATAVFAMGGLAYLGTALYFRVPVPVQPLKAFAAAAIALDLHADVIAAGALLMSVSMAVLAATGLAARAAERFPLVLVRGIQASVALLLAKAAVELAQRGNWKGLPPVSRELGLATAVAACAALFLLRGRRLPGTLLVLAGGAPAGAVGTRGGPPPDLRPRAAGLSPPGPGALGKGP